MMTTPPMVIVTGFGTDVMDGASVIVSSRPTGRRRSINSSQPGQATRRPHRQASPERCRKACRQPRPRVSRRPATPQPPCINRGQCCRLPEQRQLRRQFGREATETVPHQPLQTNHKATRLRAAAHQADEGVSCDAVPHAPLLGVLKFNRVGQMKHGSSASSRRPAVRKFSTTSCLLDSTTTTSPPRNGAARSCKYPAFAMK